MYQAYYHLECLIVFISWILWVPINIHEFFVCGSEVGYHNRLSTVSRQSRAFNAVAGGIEKKNMDWVSLLLNIELANFIQKWMIGNVNRRWNGQFTHKHCSGDCIWKIILRQKSAENNTSAVAIYFQPMDIVKPRKCQGPCNRCRNLPALFFSPKSGINP